MAGAELFSGRGRRSLTVNRRGFGRRSKRKGALQLMLARPIVLRRRPRVGSFCTAAAAWSWALALEIIFLRRDTVGWEAAGQR